MFSYSQLVPLVAGLAVLSATPAWAWQAPVACGECAPCAAPCGPVKTHCPPYFFHYFEGAPKLKFKRGCPRPICDPCNLPHFGYYQTCWAPWPYPEDWNHCPTPTPSQMLPPPEKPLFAPRVAVPMERQPDREVPRQPAEPRQSEEPRQPVKPLDEPPATKPMLPNIPPLPNPKPLGNGSGKPSVRLIYPD